MKIKLFVDDLRQAPEGWVLARTITQAIRLLATQEVEMVSLDHDIVFTNAKGLYTGEASQENYTAVAWFIREMPPTTRPQTVYVHTANPEGAKSIFSILRHSVENIIRDESYRHEWLSQKDYDKLSEEQSG